jgi:hypothetical protein
MSLVVNTTKIHIPKSKGKIDRRVVSKGKYVEYHLREWLRHNLGVINEIELDRLAKTITNLLVRIIGGDNVAMLSVSFRYSGVIRVSDMEKSYYNFDLSVYVNGKLIHVYQFIANRPEIFVDNSVDYFANSDFAGIADYVINHNSVMPRFDMPDSFMDIANYVTEYVKAYGKERKREINVYAYANSIREFLAFLNEYVDIFNDKELRRLVGTKYVYYWYRYLRNSGYFTVYHGDIE